MLGVDRRRVGVASNLQLVRLHDPPQRVVEQVGVVGGPEVQVERVQPVHVAALVHGVGRGKAPLRAVLLRSARRTGALAGEAVDGEGEEARVLVRVVDADRVELAGEGILLWRARMVRDLDAARPPYGVVVEVDVGALVEAVVRRLLVGRGDVVVHVGEEGQQRHLALLRRHLVCATRQ